MSIHTVIILGYFLAVTLIGLAFRRMASGSSADYLIAGRNLGMAVCAAMVAAEWLGGMSTIGVSERAYETMSLQPVLYNLSTAAGMVVIGFTVASRYRRMRVHTVSEMLEALFGPSARSVSAVCFLLAYLTLAYVQLQTCASVLAPLLGLKWSLAVFLSAALITLYTYFGGMRALAVTGIVYLVTMYAGLGSAFVIGLGKVGGTEGLAAALAARGAPLHPYNPFGAGIGRAGALLLGGLLGGMAAQASIQPVFAARDERTARRSAFLAAVIVAPFGVLTAFLGLFARSGLIEGTGSIERAGNALPALLGNPSFVPPLIGGLALAGVLAAILSTVGPVNFAVVTIAAKDIYQGILRRDAGDDRVVRTARRLVVLVSAVTVPLALLMRGAVLDTAYISYAIRAIGAIVIVMGVYAKRLVTPTGVRLAFALGTASVLLSVAAQGLGWFSVDKTYGAVVVTLSVVLISTAVERLTGGRGEGRRTPR